MKIKQGIVRKVLKVILIITIFLTSSLFAYTHIVENRSVRSWAWENFQWAVGLKRPVEREIEEDFDKSMKESQEKSDLLVTPPKLSVDVKEEEFEGMQVFIWNDNQNSNQKVIFYLHGGAYISDPASAHFKTVDELSQTLDAKVVFPIYPKAPRYNYLDTLPKIEALYKRTLKETSSSQNITLMGDSAGGGLALGLAYKLRDDKINQPKDIILASPWLDLNMDNPDIANYESKDPLLNGWELSHIGEIWAGGKENMKNTYVSPIYGDMQGLGRITMFTGTREIFYPDIMKFDKLLTDAGIDHTTIVGKNQNHVYAVMPIIPEGKEARKEMIKIINNK